MNILITNDDGIHAPGILALADAFAATGKVTVVAPEYEQSGVSHALTFLKPFFATEVDSMQENVRSFAVNGTPADCTKVGIVEICDTPPDVVVSGINGGLNCGINCLYSGTLGGAREASFFEIPSFAFSVEVRRKGEWSLDHVRRAAELAQQMVPQILAMKNNPRTCYNINFSIESLEKTPESVWVPMETERFRYEFQKGMDPTGRSYFWTKHSPSENGSPFETDISAIAKGKISITPMSYDLTDQTALRESSVQIDF